MESKLGKERLVALMDLKVGRLELGSVDTALRANIEVAKLLKTFGASEQVESPADWASSRRRKLRAHTTSVRTTIRRGARGGRDKKGMHTTIGGYSSSSGGYNR